MRLVSRKWLILSSVAILCTPALAFAEQSLTFLPGKNKPTIEFLLTPLENVASSIHSQKEELAYLIKELETGSRFYSRSEFENLVSRAKDALSPINKAELDTQWNLFLQLKDLRWTKRTNLANRYLMQHRDVMAYEDRRDKIKSDRQEVLALREQLDQIIKRVSSEENLVHEWLKVFFPTKKAGDDTETRTAEVTRFEQLTVEEEELPETQSDRRAASTPQTCAKGAVCWESVAQAATYGAGSDFGDGDGLPPVNHIDNSTVSSAEDISNSACGRYSGPYCGKSLSDVIEMKRLEREQGEDF